MNYARCCRVRQAATLFGLSERHYDHGVPEDDQTQREPKSVRETVAANIKRIRKMRDMTGREFIAQLGERGVKLLPSGLTAMEKGERRLTVEEMLAIAIVLNTSVIDLLSPVDGWPMEVAKDVEPLESFWLELWLNGAMPWPQEPAGDAAVTQLEEFLASASTFRRTMQRRDMRPEMQAIRGLEEAVRRAIELEEDTKAESGTTGKAAAALLRDQLEEVSSYVNLLAKRIERSDGG